MSAMQDLVGISIADAAESPWIGQRAFERVILGEQPPAKLFIRSVQDLQPTRIVLRELLAAAKHVERSSALGAGFSQCERSRVKHEVGECGPARLARPGGKPVQPA